jgi:hypothetical protein
MILGIFFKGSHPSHDDNGKTVKTIEKLFFAFDCQLKKLNGEFFFRITGSPVIHLLNRKYPFSIQYHMQIPAKLA